MITKLIKLLETPFKENLILLISWFLLMAGPDLFFLYTQEKYCSIMYFIGRNFVFSYIFVFFLGLIKPKFLKLLYTACCYFAIMVFFIIDIFCITKLDNKYNYDMAAIVAGTNPNEAFEFLHTYFSITVIIILLVVILLVVILHKVNKKFKISNHLVCKFSILFLIGCIVLSIKNKEPLNGILTKYKSFFEFSKTPNLKEYEKDPHIEKGEHTSPQNIIFIIGESFAKKQSSLYGYIKETNPRLKKLQEDSLLYVYKNVEAPAAHTLEAFKYILTTYMKESNTNSKINFYECITLPNVAKHAGYKTYWISNQSKYGQNDNLVGKYSLLCDEEKFIANKFSGLTRWSFDGEIINEIKKASNDNCSHRFIFVHLMGSHFSYAARYPKNYARFNSNDYKNYPEHQRQILAEYDNSIYYNDYVISSIIDIFKDKETVVVYFSDHGQDLYDSSDDFYGASKDIDPTSYKAGIQIPLMIYTSKTYMNNYPQKIKSMKNSTNNKFCTGNIIYTMMDIMNVKFKFNDDVKSMSLLSE